MGDIPPKVFWMRESLERDFFTADKDGYTKFLDIASSVASAGARKITSPFDLMGLLDLSKLTDLNQKIGAYVNNYVATTVSGTLQDAALDKAMDDVLSNVILAGHGHVPKNKVTEQDVTRGWIELGKKSVLFLISLPVGGAPLAGLLLIFPVLKLIASIDMARKHDRYQQLIDFMLLKYQAILDRAKIKNQERLQKEHAISQQALDYNDDQHTKQDEKIVFEGVYKDKTISLSSLFISKIRNLVEDRLKQKSVNDKLINSLDGKMQTRLNYRLLPPRLTFPEVGKIYALFQSSFASGKFATEVKDDVLVKAVALVLQGKSEVADVDLLVPLRGSKGDSTMDDFDYSDLVEEDVIAEKPLDFQPKPSPNA